MLTCIVSLSQRAEPMSDPIPLYARIRRDLRERIAAGTYAPNQALPTEAQICEQFGVSRITVTKALDGLIQDGFIIRRRGVGTFVAPNAAVAKSIRLVGSMDEMLAPPASGLRRTMLSLRKVMPSSDIAGIFATGKDERVLRADWLYEAAEGVFAYATVFVPEAIGDRLTPEALSDGRPMIQIVRDVIPQRILGGQQSVEPALVDAQLAKWLDLPRRSAVLRVVRTFYAEGGRPVVVGHAWYHPQRYRYIVHLEPSGRD